MNPPVIAPPFTSPSPPDWSDTNWSDTNWQLLLAAIAQVRHALDHQSQSPPPLPQIHPPAALESLCHLFALSSFEREILLLCVGIELDPSFASLCAAVHNDGQRNYPTFHLAMTALSQPHWSAFTPDRPLRRWHLLELGAGQTLSLSPLRIDERILHYLIGVQYLDERLKSFIKPTSLDSKSPLVLSHQQIAERVAELWTLQQPISSIAQLYGIERTSQWAIASAAATIAGLQLYCLSARSLPTQAHELHQLLLFWEREAKLTQSLLLLDCSDIDPTMQEGDTARLNAAITQWIDDLNSPLIIASSDRWRYTGGNRSLMAIEVAAPTPSEQRSLWQTYLPQEVIPQEMEQLVTQFNLNTLKIKTIAAEFSLQTQVPKTSLWDLCRFQTRPRLEDLAQRIEPAADWDDLVLPDKEKQVLQTIAAHVRQRTTVYEGWGFASRGDRGLGISALFAGGSGTGKTMSAEVLAQTLQLDLYRIDLSSVVSKYIGETEKNLRQVFDAAEAGAAILLFDEADALFGKRSEVKDSHDRYANMEVSYLLQRMEAYQGLAVLTSNLKDAIDPAFLRRIRFVVKYPFPETAQRKEIWQRVFPKQTPIAGLDWERLARLNVAGGNIRNIALNAAFIAAELGESVQMCHLLEATQAEYIKLERTLTEAEVKGWV
jgi:hypothetical protein